MQTQNSMSGAHRLAPARPEMSAASSVGSWAAGSWDHVQAAVLLLIRRACTALPHDEVALDTPLLALGLDSLKLMELIFDLEEHYQIEVDEALLVELDVINDLVSMVNMAVNKGGATLPDGMPESWADEED